MAAFHGRAGPEGTAVRAVPQLTGWLPPDAHPFAGDPVFDLHVGGRIEVRSTVALAGRAELSLAYTPGVARVCAAIAEDP